MRDSAIIYRSFFEAIKELPEKDQAKVWNAVFEFSLNFNEIELSGISKTIFTLIKPQLKANQTKYINGNKQKGSKTEAKRKLNVSKTEGNVNVNVNDNVNVNVNVNENEISPEFLFNYMIEGKEILSVEETFKEKFQITFNDLNAKHGELKIKRWLADFSELHKQKSWKDLQDFRHHIASYILKVSQIENQKNATTKHITTEKPKVGGGPGNF